MGRRLNHSRYLDYGARDTGNYAYYKAKTTPTAKQIKFYKRLYATCKANDIDPSTGEYTLTRVDYAMAIDKLLKRLQEHGIDISGNGKESAYVIKHGSDKSGRYYTREYIEVTDRDKKIERGGIQ